MEVVSDVNAIHESTHGWQIHSGKITGEGKGKMTHPSIGFEGRGEGLFRNEIAAYKRQYAFDALSVQNNLPSYPKNAGGIEDITRNWLLGINVNGNFIYARILLGTAYDPKTIKKYLNSQQ